MEPDYYNVQLPKEHMRIIMRQLAELPYKVAAPILNNLLPQTDQQEGEQLKQEQEPAA